MHGHIGSIFIPDDRKVSFSSLLSFYHTILKDKIRALRVLNDMSSNMIENYLVSEKEKFRNKVDATLNKEEKEEYYVNLSVGIISNSKYIIKNPKIAGLLAKETEMYNHRENIRRASKESVLVYLVIIFEEFLSNLLSALFMKRHDVLKGSNKIISYVDALEYTDIYELVKTISKIETKDIVESSIEKLNEHLENRFHLCLSRRTDWPKFKEFFYRRNIVVHNYGVLLVLFLAHSFYLHNHPMTQNIF
jgi:hypothetical protein